MLRDVQYSDSRDDWNLSMLIILDIDNVEFPKKKVVIITHAFESYQES